MNLSDIPPPFGSPPIVNPPPYPMSCVAWGESEKLAVAVVAGTAWGFLVSVLGIIVYRQLSNRPSLIKYNRRILTNMDSIPENQTMENV
jgi:hypothetical protein